MLDRSILIEVQRIEPRERKVESDILAEFEGNRSRIMGGVFNVVSLAMKIYSTLDLEHLPRMADFAKWGYAISEALGYGGELFVRAYERNGEKQNEEALEAEPVAIALRRLMDYQEMWEGEPTELYAELKNLLQELKIDERIWPKSVNALGRKIREIKSNLKNDGLIFEESKGTKRKYFLRKTDGDTAVIDLSSRETKVEKVDKVDVQAELELDKKIKNGFDETDEIKSEPLDPEKDE